MVLMMILRRRDDKDHDAVVVASWENVDSADRGGGKGKNLWVGGFSFFRRKVSHLEIYVFGVVVEGEAWVNPARNAEGIYF